MKKTFPNLLSSQRKQAHLTNRELAEIASVPASLISGLQAGSRRVGEFQATKIADALGLKGTGRAKFIFDAIDTSTEKLLKSCQTYSAQLLNWLPLVLRGHGINPLAIDEIETCASQNLSVLVLKTNRGATAVVTTIIT